MVTEKSMRLDLADLVVAAHEALISVWREVVGRPTPGRSLHHNLQPQSVVPAAD